VQVTHTTLRSSGGHGFVLGDSNTITLSDFSNNTITGNTGAAGYIMDPDTACSLKSSSSYAGNGTNGVIVLAATYLDKAAGTFAAIDAPYLITGGSNDVIEVQKALTIEAGATLAFSSTSGLLVTDNGALKAVGTSTAPITFTGVQKTAGYWMGVCYRNTPSVDNVLSYVVMEYGGSTYFSYADSQKANLAITVSGTSYSCQVQVTHTTLRSSGGHGFVLGDSNTITLSDFSNNTITSNTGAAGYIMDPDTACSLKSSSSYAGNGTNGVIVLAATYLDKAAGTFAAIDAPYLITGGSNDVIEVQKALTIEAGATLAFSSTSGLLVTENGALKAVGTSTLPITFTGVQKTAGYWMGVCYRNTPSVDNVLDYVVMEYGGSTYFSYTDSQKANLAITVSGGTYHCTVAVTNSTFSNSGGYGIVLSSSYTLFSAGLDADIFPHPKTLRESISSCLG
jgi:hypothetical protein